jgi:hypothetical protein
MNLAKRLSARFRDDGQRFRDDSGVNIEDALREMGARLDRDDASDSNRWTLADGSVVTVSGGGWDLGYAGCFCWQGEGHASDCED